MTKILFNFYSYTLELSSSSPQLLKRLGNDFSFFVTDHVSQASQQYQVIASLDLDLKIPSDLVAIHQTAQFMLFKKEHTRYIDYYGAALSEINDSAAIARITADSIDRLHEITYLFILSQVGKAHDQMGLHKVHSFGVKRRDTAIIGMMPMKGGKTTTFLHLLNDASTEIISDDCPLINLKGEVLPFPLRVGVENEDSLPNGDKEKLYTINRREYGIKTLAPLCYFSNSVSSAPAKKIILLVGIRSTYHTPKICHLNRFKCLLALSTHMVAGLGLPMVIEYFLRFDWRDYPNLFKLSFSRGLTAIRLLLRAESYQITLSTDPQLNAKYIEETFWK